MAEKVFKNALKKYNLLKKKDKVVLGVSGGPDSVFMLYQFARIKKEYRLNLVCAHFNHSLRNEADEEEQFIKNLCNDLGIKCISEKKNVKAFLKGDSLEQTARNLRFDFLLKCCRQTKIKTIALAHHKDDLIETILMRFIKGAGLRGLRGFLPKTRFKGATVIRPLIDMRKKEIVSWLKQNKIPYCIDKSNFEEKFLRNRIRLKLLPDLAELNPNIVDSLSNLARNVSLDYDFIYSLARDEFMRLKRKETAKSLYLDLEGITQLPLAIFNNVIRIAIEQVKGNIRKIEARHLDEVRDLVLHRRQASIVDLPDILIKKEVKELIIQSLIL